MTCKVFAFNKIRVFFKHTDYYGYAHPYNFYEWTSYVRESFFQEVVPGYLNVLDRSIKMMTSKIELKTYCESSFGKDLQAIFSVARVKKCSFDVIVKFYNMPLNEMVCSTRHTLVFWNSLENQFAQIPPELYASILHYKEEEL